MLTLLPCNSLKAVLRLNNENDACCAWRTFVTHIFVLNDLFKLCLDIIIIYYDI